MNYKQNKQTQKNNLKYFDNYPEYILITITKLMNFLFGNSVYFVNEFFDVPSERAEEWLLNFGGQQEVDVRIGIGIDRRLSPGVGHWFVMSRHSLLLRLNHAQMVDVSTLHKSCTVLIVNSSTSRFSSEPSMGCRANIYEKWNVSQMSTFLRLPPKLKR